jgi:hypothetical protein
VGDADILQSQLAAVDGNKMVCQGQDLIPPVAQRWQVDRRDIDAVVEIAQLIAMKKPLRPLCSWMKRATSFSPEPVSPTKRTVASVGAMRSR